MDEALDRVEKFLAYTTLAEPLPWQNSTLLKGDVAEAAATLKVEHDKTITGVIIATYRLAPKP
jgi:hypothetical protein